MRTLSVIAFSILCLFFFACDEEIGNSKDVNPETIYFDYSITQNGTTDADLLLYFRFAGPNGTTLVLNEPSQVKLDGVIIPLDSSDGMGAYYEQGIPYNKLTGTHEIVFTDINGKKYANSFQWNNMTCDESIPGRISLEQLFIPVQGGINGDELEVTVNDTAFDTNESTLQLKIKNGGVIIPADAFAIQKEGPVDISISKNTENALAHTTAEGGRIRMYQHIKTLSTVLVYGYSKQE